MEKKKEPSISCSEIITRIYTPLNIAEETQSSGFVFSKRFLEMTGLKKKDLTRTFFEGSKVFRHIEVAKQLASDGAGGATTGENFIKIWVNPDQPNAGSDANFIWMYFGTEKRVRLWGLNQEQFPAGQVLTWDLNDIHDWLEDNIETDLWDEIALVTDSANGILIDRIKIRHSSQTILDWQCNLWLDGSKTEAYTKLVLTSKILEAKLSKVDQIWVPQIHWAAREIGKTDGSKYGAGEEAWCSEFASWCLRKSLWDTPSGRINSQTMEDYFSDMGRKYTHDQLIDGDYQLVAGDYIRFEFSLGGHHSGIFIEYIDDPTSPSEGTSIRTIEGNSLSTVRVATRAYQDILSVGNCQ